MARPSSFEQARREREFLGWLAHGLDPSVAAQQAKLSPERVLVLLDDPSFRAAVFELAEQAAAA